MTRISSSTYQIKVTLAGSHPPIWRRILVPANATLLKLHDILQIAMGWENRHLHSFTIDRSVYGDLENDEYGEFGIKDEARYKLSQVLRREGQSFSYIYDFGDGWRHALLVEKILSPQAGVRNPLCLAGKRACPPEDVGGLQNFYDFLDANNNPNLEDDEYSLQWIGGEFDPEAFDLADVNAQLKSMGRGSSTEAQDPWTIVDDGFPPKDYVITSPWSQTLPQELKQVAGELPLRRDVVTLLNYLLENKVTGTPSTGNLPLKAVSEISANFVHPPRLSLTLGKKVNTVHSETEVWPLYFCHTLASVGWLVTGGQGKRWRVTSLGEQFMAATPAEQVWFLWMTWWERVNWVLASPYGYAEDFFPSSFSYSVLKILCELRKGEIIHVEPFYDRLIRETPQAWPVEDLEGDRKQLHKIVESVVVDRMLDFGVLQAEFEPHKLLGPEFPVIKNFQITVFGKGLLKAMLARANEDLAKKSTRNSIFRE